jgi:hypothetical protein
VRAPHWQERAVSCQGANTQGVTLDEVRKNLHEAVQLVLEANRELPREERGQCDVVREDLRLDDWVKRR